MEIYGVVWLGVISSAAVWLSNEHDLVFVAIRPDVVLKLSGGMTSFIFLVISVVLLIFAVIRRALPVFVTV